MTKFTVLFIAAITSIHFAQLRPTDNKDWNIKLKRRQNIWERSGKYQGDIILQPDRNAVYDKEFYWPNNELPYQISENFSTKDRNTIMRSLSYIRNNTCIKPIPWRETDEWGIYFSEKSGHGCSSTVGFWKKKQTVNLDVKIGCVQYGVVLHELLHTLGMWHQQSAHNRDDYVDIIWENIEEGAEHNFDKANTASTGATGSFGYQYDYDSIMHYSPYAFSVNGNQTIVPKLTQRGSHMGQRAGLSFIDLGKLRAMYECKEPADN